MKKHMEKALSAVKKEAKKIADKMDKAKANIKKEVKKLKKKEK